MRGRTFLAAGMFMSALLRCSTFPDLSSPKGAYLGSGLPGEEPELFAPGMICTGMYERDMAMMPDGGEIYVGFIAGGVVSVFGTRLDAGRWTAPEIVPAFAGHPESNFFEPHITPDGKRMLFLCTHPPEGKEPRPGWYYQNLWAVDRLEGGGWGEIYDIGAPVNTDDNEYFPSVTRSGTLYFTRSVRGSRETRIFRARPAGGGYARPEALPASVNGEGNPYNAFIDPDERYLVACVAGREDTFSPGQPNYYVFFRSEDDRWSEAINLGERVNTPGIGATSAYVSPDGRFFFFASTRLREDVASGGPVTLGLLKDLHGSPGNGSSDIYWMDASFIQALRPEGF